MLEPAPQAVDLIQAHLRWLGLPELLVTKACEDRAWGSDPTGKILYFCEVNSKKGMKNPLFYQELESTTQMNHPGALRSFRERTARGSLQVTEHPNGLLEIDHDLNGLAPLKLLWIFRHWGEGLCNRFTKRKTDQRLVAAILRQRGILAS